MTSSLAINARVMRHEDVAERFVPPDFFEKIASRNHIVMLGPRGSGKTTLLTMLTRPALRAWPTERLGPRPTVDYLGVLVRADLTWSRQLRTLGLAAGSTEDQATVLHATYINHALLATARYVRDYFRFDEEGRTLAGSYSGTIEAEVTRSIAATWRLPEAEARNFSQLKELLNQRASVLWDWSTAPPDERPPEFKAASRVDLFAAVASMAEAMEDVGAPGSIGLLLDELELVPATIREYLRTGLRDADQRTVIKMSLSPVEVALNNLLGQHDAVAGHDYLPVDLTYPQKIDGYKFTSALLLDLARRSDLVPRDIDQLLGRSYFDLPTGNRRAARAGYAARGDIALAMQSLSKFDPSFTSYLLRSGVTPDAIPELDEEERAALIRKIRDIVLVRNRFLRMSHNELGTMSRTGVRSYDFYSGRDSVLALLEGNPRWAVNFIATATSGAPPNGRSLNRPRQARGLADLVARVRSRVRHTPVPADSVVEIDPTRGQRVLSLVSAIAVYMRTSILSEEFNPDPVLTFVVDDDAADADIDLVSDAVSHGALIHVPRRDQVGSLTSVRGERFRLAYLIAAQYGLPPILGREVNLSGIRERQTINDGPSEDEDPEMRLFS